MCVLVHVGVVLKMQEFGALAVEVVLVIGVLMAVGMVLE